MSGSTVAASARPGDPAAAAAAAVRAGRRARERRGRAVVVVLVVLLLAAAAVAMSTGRSIVSLPTVVQTLLGQDTGEQFTVLDLRLPRVLGAMLVGSALGLAGAIFQSLVQNPLASPDVLGITTGASAAAVFLLLVVDASAAVVALGAVGGAMVTAMIIYLLAWRQGITGYRFVLVGIGVAAVLSAVISYQLTATRVEEASEALVWLTGSLNGTTIEQCLLLAAVMLVTVPLVGMLARPLGILQMGDDAAGGLGLRVERTRLALVVVAVVLAAAATATAGPVVFVALVAAPIARRLVPHGLAFLPSALVGALLVLVADYAGQYAIPDVRLPVGVITGLVGGPYLLWLLATANREGRL